MDGANMHGMAAFVHQFIQGEQAAFGVEPHDHCRRALPALRRFGAPPTEVGVGQRRFVWRGFKLELYFERVQVGA